MNNIGEITISASHMAHTMTINIVIISLYLKHVQFGEEKIQSTLVTWHNKSI